MLSHESNPADELKVRKIEKKVDQGGQARIINSIN
jgi:hypothetical protein